MQQLPERIRVVSVAAALLIGPVLSGCASVASLPGVGLPANTPARPEVQPAYLPLGGDTPPARAVPVLSPQEQDQIEKELAAARERQSAVIKAKPSSQPAN